MLDAGVDDVAHMPLDPAPLASLQNMVDRGVYITPTFTVLRNFGAALGTAESNLAQFVKLGGKVALGNDYGGGPGDFELGIRCSEIEEMSLAGNDADADHRGLDVERGPRDPDGGLARNARCGRDRRRAGREWRSAAGCRGSEGRPLRRPRRDGESGA